MLLLSRNQTYNQWKDVFSISFVVFFPFQGKMIAQDKLEKEKNDAKNSVEEYVYDMREKLCDKLEKFVSEKVCILWCKASANTFHPE